MTVVVIESYVPILLTYGVKWFFPDLNTDIEDKLIIIEGKSKSLPRLKSVSLYVSTNYNLQTTLINYLNWLNYKITLDSQGFWFSNLGYADFMYVIKFSYSSLTN